MRRWTGISKLVVALALAGWMLPASWLERDAALGADDPEDPSRPAGYEQDAWRWDLSLDEGSNKVGIMPRHGRRENDFGTLEEALGSLEEDQVVVWIRIDPVPLLSSNRMQQELFEYFERQYPEELRVASASSGNLHNPALRPLMAGYREAVLSTTYVAELRKILARHGHRITGVSFEKFSLDTDRKPPRFSAITALEVEK